MLFQTLVATQNFTVGASLYATVYFELICVNVQCDNFYYFNLVGRTKNKSAGIKANMLHCKALIKRKAHQKLRAAGELGAHKSTTTTRETSSN